MMTDQTPANDVVATPMPEQTPEATPNEKWMGQGRASRQARRAGLARKRSKRRRRIDPTTCDRDYSPAELEFLQAIQAYKQQSGHMFPTWGEVLKVLHDLGYRKADGPETGTEPTSEDSGTGA